jgi:integrase
MPKSFTLLTRTAMRRLRPNERVSERGITFHRLSNSDGAFSVNVMVDGQRIHRVVGRESDGTTRTQAEEFIQKLRQDAKHDRLSLPKGRKVALSFRDAAGKYLKRLAEEGGNDLAMKRTRLEKHLSPFFGAMPLSKISSFDVERYKKLRQEQPAQRGKNKEGKITYVGTIKGGTVNRELAALSHLFNKAIEWGWINRRPAVIRRLKENSGRISYLTVEQVEKVLEAATHDQSTLIHPFILIGLETSMRRMEILRIRRENIDLDRLIIYIPQAKAGAREQPITTHLADYLREYLKSMPEEQQWLFASATSASGHLSDIRKAFRRVISAAGLNPDEIVRHTLRHTAITHLVQAGVDLPTIKRISGHKTLIMVERYAHANGEHIRAAMDKLGNRYRKAH